MIGKQLNFDGAPMTPLCMIAEKHGTDKFSKHNYTKVYYELLAGRVGSVRRVLEIGIKRGASLRMWAEFFPGAKITGVDIKEKNLFTEDRIATFLGDQMAPSSLTKIGRERGPFDLIVDDGCHHAPHQTSAARWLLPFLAPGGIYIIEDIKHGPVDNPDTIVRRLRGAYECELVFTTDKIDNGMMIIRKR
jgi:predicted O-methyltransferase YrrM